MCGGKSRTEIDSLTIKFNGLLPGSCIARRFARSLRLLESELSLVRGADKFDRNASASSGQECRSYFFEATGLHAQCVAAGSNLEAQFARGIGRAATDLIHPF